jgi:hypothetical protein
MELNSRSYRSRIRSTCRPTRSRRKTTIVPPTAPRPKEDEYPTGKPPTASTLLRPHARDHPHPRGQARPAGTEDAHVARPQAGRNADLQPFAGWHRPSELDADHFEARPLQLPRGSWQAGFGTAAHHLGPRGRESAAQVEVRVLSSACQQ